MIRQLRHAVVLRNSDSPNSIIILLPGVARPYRTGRIYFKRRSLNPFRWHAAGSIRRANVRPHDSCPYDYSGRVPESVLQYYAGSGYRRIW